MPISGYFDVPFAEGGELTAVPDATQVDGSVSYTQGYPILYSTAVGSGGYDFPRLQHNQILNDITSAVQYLQQHSAPAFITTAMNGGSPYSYPKYACVNLSGVNYISLQASNTDTPPSSKWAIAFGGISGSLTPGHLAVFADANGTIADGGAVPSGYTLPAATTSVLGGVIPDGTIITVDGTGHITVPFGTASAKGVLEVDNSTIGVASGVISIKSSAPLPGSPTTTTQSPGDNSNKIATTAYVDRTRFTSSQQSITAAGMLTLAHGLGVAPFSINTYVVNTTAENGYNVGDKLLISFGGPFGASGSGATGAAITFDATNIYVTFANSANVLDTLLNKSSGNAVTPFNQANWNLVVQATA